MICVILFQLLHCSFGVLLGSCGYFFLILFIYFQLCCVFIARGAFLQLWRVGTTLSLPCAGFSFQWFLLLWSTGSRACGLQELWLPASRAQALQLWHMGLVAPWHVGSSWSWDRTHISRITTESPGKPCYIVFTCVYAQKNVLNMMFLIKHGYFWVIG